MKKCFLLLATAFTLPAFSSAGFEYTALLNAQPTRLPLPPLPTTHSYIPPHQQHQVVLRVQQIIRNQLEHTYYATHLVIIPDGGSLDSNSISNLAARFPRLTHLTVRHLNLSPEAIMTLTRNFPSLTYLDISFNNLGDTGLRALANSVFASQLETLNLSHTQISWRAIELGLMRDREFEYSNSNQLSFIIKCAFTSLRHLDISHNQELGQQALIVLAASTLAPQLISLNVINTGITQLDEIAFGNFRNLEQLSAQNNSIHHERVERILMSLVQQDQNMLARVIAKGFKQTPSARL